MRCFVPILLLVLSPLHAANVNVAELQSPDEIVQIRALWAIAQAGKASKATDADILPLLTKTWRGKRLSPWCFHALVKLGVPPDKHLAVFLDAARSWERQPEGAKIPEAEWRAAALGPDLPEDLKAASITVWNSVLDKLIGDFEHADEGHVDNYRGILPELLVPKDLLVPRLTAILVDPKKTTSQRNVSGLILSRLGRYAGSVDALIKGLSDPAMRVRSTCASALVMQGRESSVFGQSSGPAKFEDPEKLFAALLNSAKTDSDKQVRSAAVSALRHVGPQVPTAIPTLIELARAQKADRARVLSALTGFDSAEPIPYFVECLTDSDAEVQTAAAEKLELFARRMKKAALFTNAKPALEKLAREAKDPNVKAKAEEALKSIHEAK